MGTQGFCNSSSHDAESSVCVKEFWVNLCAALIERGERLKMISGAVAEPVPKVGVGVMVVKGSQVLIGKRRSSIGDGTYALPGGHLDFGTSSSSCAFVNFFIRDNNIRSRFVFGQLPPKIFYCVERSSHMKE